MMIWFCGAVILLATGVLVAGWRGDDAEQAIPILVVVSIFWPITAAGAAVVLPLWGLYKLGYLMESLYWERKNK